MASTVIFDRSASPPSSRSLSCPWLSCSTAPGGPTPSGRAGEVVARRWAIPRLRYCILFGICLRRKKVDNKGTLVEWARLTVRREQKVDLSRVLQEREAVLVDLRDDFLHLAQVLLYVRRCLAHARQSTNDHLHLQG